MPVLPTTVDADKFWRDGFVTAPAILQTDSIAQLHQSFDDLFDGRFETGVRPDEVNWQSDTGQADLTRQICNGWKADRRIAQVVLNETLGRTIAELAGWPGVRMMIDNVIWKPVGAKSLGFHQDSAYLSWFTPSDLLTCWIALDDTSAAGGTLEFARGSHRWALSQPEGEFHAPKDYRQTVEQAATAAEQDVDVAYVEVAAGGASFHHGYTWHGSGQNAGTVPRRALVLHAMRADVEYVPANFDQGIGPIYSRYKRLGDNKLDENFFPILWREDGYRTAAIDRFLE